MLIQTHLINVRRFDDAIDAVARMPWVEKSSFAANKIRSRAFAVLIDIVTHSSKEMAMLDRGMRHRLGML